MSSNYSLMNANTPTPWGDPRPRIPPASSDGLRAGKPHSERSEQWPGWPVAWSESQAWILASAIWERHGKFYFKLSTRVVKLISSTASSTASAWGDQVPGRRPRLLWRQSAFAVQGSSPGEARDARAAADVKRLLNKWEFGLLEWGAQEKIQVNTSHHVGVRWNQAH